MDRRLLLRLRWLFCLLFFYLAGCVNYGVIQNEPMDGPFVERGYNLLPAMEGKGSNEVSLVLTFSGGGTRAAALAYGVLQALHEITITTHSSTNPLVREVDAISSVSGGSFTAAYYGLNGEATFETFEDAFLRYDISAGLKYRLLNPVLWFSRKSRTEMAIEYYDKLLFHGARFSDFQQVDGPLIIINATDLGAGVRFSFLQEYFDLICADLSTFPVSRAVAASSAVPLVFNPVVLKNYASCDSLSAAYLAETRAQTADSPVMEDVTEGLASYSNKESRRYIHLVDGGISDNLGLLAIYEMIETSGGIKPFLDAYNAPIPPYFVVISVDASTSPHSEMDLTNRTPSIMNTVGSMTDIQLHRTNARTLELLQDSSKQWAASLSTPDFVVHPYIVEVGFNGIEDPDRRDWFNQIPTGFSLTAEQSDALIKVGKNLLLNNSEFKRFLRELNSD